MPAIHFGFGLAVDGVTAFVHCLPLGKCNRDDQSAMPDILDYDNKILSRILDETKTIAMVGASANPNRPSSFAMKYLQGKGYKVIPVNPGQAGNEILGEMTYATLAEVPGPYEVVDIFRNSDAAGDVTDETIGFAADKGIKTVWMQLGVRNDAAAERAEAAGLTCIMERCIKIEYGRLNGELSWGGVNTGVISSKRRKIRS